MKEKQDKKSAFMELYEPVHDNFERFCRARTYGELDYKDVMHDSIVIAYEKFEAVESPKSFLYFLFGITIRVLANARKKKKPVQFNDDRKLIDIEDRSMNAEHTDRNELLYTALAQLPEIQREAIVLFEISGFSIAEIAELQGAGISAIKQRLARGRQALLELLSTENVEQKELTA